MASHPLMWHALKSGLIRFWRMKPKQPGVAQCLRPSPSLAKWTSLAPGCDVIRDGLSLPGIAALILVAVLVGAAFSFAAFPSDPSARKSIFDDEGSC